MECLILNNCSLGILPADVLRPIVLQTNWRGAMAVALSCKYWYKEFRDKIVHPMIAVLAKGDCWWMFRRGQIYGVDGTIIRDHEFDTVKDILRFKEEYQLAMKDEERIKRFTEHPSSIATVVKIRDVNGEERLLTKDNTDNSLMISLVDAFIIRSDVICNETKPNFVDERPGNLIKIDICHSLSPCVVLEVHVDIWGNIRYSYIRCRAGISTTFYLNRDPKLFCEIRDILVYPKHAKSVVFPKEQKDEDHRSFKATYTAADAKKTYQVQHLIVTKGWKHEPVSVVTNDYKKDAMAKIVRLLSSTLTGSLNRFEMNDWASTTDLVSPWNSLMIQPIKLQSSLKDEGLSCIHQMSFSGRTSKTARLDTVRLDISFDGEFSLDIYCRTRNGKSTLFYEKTLRHPDLKKIQQFFNEFEVVEKVRNSRDNTEKSYKKLGDKEKKRIEPGKVTQYCHSVKNAFCGSTFFSAKHNPFCMRDNYRWCQMSPKGFEFAWKFIMQAITEIDLLPK